MSTEPDLQVDTDWIRRAAATLQRTGEQFSPGTGGPLPSVGSYSLGTSAAAIEVVELVIRRGSRLAMRRLRWPSSQRPSETTCSAPRASSSTWKPVLPEALDELPGGISGCQWNR